MVFHNKNFQTIKNIKVKNVTKNHQKCFYIDAAVCGISSSDHGECFADALSLGRDVKMVVVPRVLNVTHAAVHQLLRHTHTTELNQTGASAIGQKD